MSGHGTPQTERVLIMGAAGRDFHNFNVCFRDDSRYEVVGFTASQIPSIDGRVYPPELAGSLYPHGIPIYPENHLDALIREHRVDKVAFSYSDISHEEVMHRASLVTARGADFILIGTERTMLTAGRPVVAVCAVRTGCGKSPATRHVFGFLRRAGRRPVVVRHPMPYGDLSRQAVQRFACREDFNASRCTIEEREEYEPLIEQGAVVFAGVDYARVLAAAEEEGDIIIWDGGNNDTPFFRPNVHVVVFDPHRAGHERRYYPGETNMHMADIAVIGKVDSAAEHQVRELRATIESHAPATEIVLAETAIIVTDGESIAGKRVLVVEDGPTVTHGGMSFGAGVIAANRYGAAEVVDPRPWVVGGLADAFDEYPHLSRILPAMGYSEAMVRDLETTINAADCDMVLCATPVDLSRIISVNRPVARVRYEYRDHGEPTLEACVMERLELDEAQPSAIRKGTRSRRP